MLEAFDFVIFGGAGDLALRKLVPAFYRAYRNGELPEGARIIPVLRNPAMIDTYKDKIREAGQKYLGNEFVAADWDQFAECVTPALIDIAVKDEHWDKLAELLNKGNKQRVFYLSTPPSVFGIACKHLSETGLITPTARVVVEKPIGYSGESAEVINSQVAEYFVEDAIFRIDHYLGKETVQNIMALRFANGMFENLWNNKHIDNIQISISETVGLEGRASFYNDAGAMRDMVQNHMMQVLCLVAMEKPASQDAEQIRAAKVNVVRSLRPLVGADVKANTVRGQYVAGTLAGQAVPGYSDELGAQSDIETYVAIRAHIDNERWSGVPFYIRTGKRMPERFAEVVVQFKADANPLFNGVTANRLVIRIQPDESIKFIVNSLNVSKHGNDIDPLVMNVSFKEVYPTFASDAYKRLMLDAASNNPSLFIHRNEVDASWAWVDPIISAWQLPENKPQAYPAGSWGPAAADALLAQDGFEWFLLDKVAKA